MRRPGFSPRLSRFSLRARLLLLTASLLLAGLTLISAVVSDRLERYQIGRLDSQLRSLATLVSRVPKTGPPDMRGALARPDLLDPGLDLFGTAYLVYLNADGTVARSVHTPGSTPRPCPHRTRCASCPPAGRPKTCARRTDRHAGAPPPVPPSAGTGR